MVKTVSTSRKNHYRGFRAVPIGAFCSEKSGLQHIKNWLWGFLKCKFGITFFVIDSGFENVKNWTIFEITFFLRKIKFSDRFHSIGHLFLPMYTKFQVNRSFRSSLAEMRLKMVKNGHFDHTTFFQKIVESDRLGISSKIERDEPCI
jgi:hypothetical protein